MFAGMCESKHSAVIGMSAACMCLSRNQTDEYTPEMYVDVHF